MAKTNPTDGSDSQTAEVLTLKRPHTHDGVEYPVGHEFTAEEWGLTDKQVGWLMAIETI